MKLGIIPENMLERVALAAGVVPRPMLDTLVAILLARTNEYSTRGGDAYTFELSLMTAVLS